MAEPNLLNDFLQNAFGQNAPPLPDYLDCRREIFSQIAKHNQCRFADFGIAKRFAGLIDDTSELWFCWPPGKLTGLTEIFEENSVSNRSSIQNDEELYFFPRGCPPGNPSCIVSSRIGRKLTKQPEWFQALRTYAATLDDDQYLLTCKGTCTDRFMDRVSFWYNRDLVRLLQIVRGQLLSVLKNVMHGHSPTTRYAFRVVSSQDLLLGNDHLQIANAGSVHVLKLSENGNIHRAIAEQLVDIARPIRPTKKIFLLVGKSISENSHYQMLFDSGAIAWYLYDTQKQQSDIEPGSGNPTKPIEATTQRNVGSAKVLSINDLNPDDYLAHFTRGHDGPWIDESEQQFIDSLILGWDCSDRDTVATLCRIVCQQQLLASNLLTRDSTPVVSFTGVPLNEFRHRRKYQSHLGRWDFELYGIAIGREWLTRAGARSVVYGDVNDWTGLAEHQRPFFQLRGKQDVWEKEKEFRMIGNIDLRSLPSDQAIVFVATEQDASNIAPLSRWPVVVLS